MTACYTCAQNTLEPASLPPRESIYDGGGWRVAHAFNSALPGWLVVVSRRHLTSLGELSSEEAAALGPLLRALSRSLDELTGAQKAYVLFLAESAGFEHVHLHVVPRMLDQPPERRAVRAFDYLVADQSEALPAAEMDRLALRLRPLVLKHAQSA